jgi:hypothetical protein
MSINFENPGNFSGNADASKANALKNPKVIGAIAGAVVIGALAMALTGGDEAKSSARLMLSSGQAVTLENPNGGLSHITAGPGMMSASVSEEDKDQSICTASAGTRGVVEEQQVIDMLSYVKVKINDGDCQGKSGWTSVTNVKATS